MAGLILPSRLRSQPQQPREIEPIWRARGVQEVFSAGRGALKGVSLAGVRQTTAAGIGPTILASSGNSLNTGVVSGSSWSLILVARPVSTPDLYVYCLRPNTATYGLAISHASIANRVGWHDGAAILDSGFSIGDGDVCTFGLTWDGSTYRWFKNGAVFASSAGAVAGAGNWFFTAYATLSSNITWPFAAFADSALDPALMREATRNPWQILKAPTSRILVDSAAATGTLITPGAAAISLAGYAPTVAQSANRVVAPGAAAVALTGYAPTVVSGANQALLPGAAALTVAGYAPTVSQGAGAVLSPGAAALGVTGHAPVVGQTANQGASPGPATLAVSGFAPSVTQQTASPNLAPGAASLSVSGHAPAVKQESASSSVGGRGGADDYYRHDEPDQAEKDLRTVRAMTHMLLAIVASGVLEEH